jgi:hypothetical protein
MGKYILLTLIFALFVAVTNFFGFQEFQKLPQMCEVYFETKDGGNLLCVS